jgi:hypothetical protein
MTYRSLHRLNRSHAGERQPRQERPRLRPCEVGNPARYGHAKGSRHKWVDGSCLWCMKTREQVTEYVL